LGRPVLRDRLDGRQLHALRPIVDELLARQACSDHAAVEVVKPLLRDLRVDRADLGACCSGAAHAPSDLSGPACLNTLTSCAWASVRKRPGARRTAVLPTRQPHLMSAASPSLAQPATGPAAS